MKLINMKTGDPVVINSMSIQHNPLTARSLNGKTYTFPGRSTFVIKSEYEFGANDVMCYFSSTGYYILSGFWRNYEPDGEFTGAINGPLRYYQVLGLILSNNIKDKFNTMVALIDPVIKDKVEQDMDREVKVYDGLQVMGGDLLKEEDYKSLLVDLLKDKEVGWRVAEYVIQQSDVRVATTIAEENGCIEQDYD